MCTVMHPNVCTVTPRTYIYKKAIVCETYDTLLGRCGAVCDMTHYFVTGPISMCTVMHPHVCTVTPYSYIYEHLYRLDSTPL